MNLTPLRKHGGGGFTLVEIMIVLGVIVLIAAIAVPAWIRARKRSQATVIWNDLKQIDAAVDQYAIETGRSAGDPVEFADWRIYVKANTRLRLTGADMFGNAFGSQVVDSLPEVPVGAFTALSDIVSTEFWSPYAIGD